MSVGLILTPKINQRKMQRIVDNNVSNLEEALTDPAALNRLCLNHHKVMPNHRKDAKVDYSLYGTKGWKKDDVATHSTEAIDQMWLLARNSDSPALFIQNICAMAAVDDTTMHTSKVFSAMFGTCVRAAYDLYYLMIDESFPCVHAACLCNQIGSFHPPNSDGYAAKIADKKIHIDQYLNDGDDDEIRDKKLKDFLEAKLNKKSPGSRVRTRDIMDESDTEDEGETQPADTKVRRPAKKARKN